MSMWCRRRRVTRTGSRRNLRGLLVWKIVMRGRLWMWRRSWRYLGCASIGRILIQDVSQIHLKGELRLFLHKSESVKFITSEELCANQTNIANQLVVDLQTKDVGSQSAVEQRRADFTSMRCIPATCPWRDLRRKASHALASYAERRNM